VQETESLEDEKLQLEKEISNLERQRHQLEFVLDSHASRCRHLAAGPPTAAAAARPDPAVKVERPGGYGRAARGAVGRPSSLSLPVAATSGGGAATTPMTFASLGLDCMVDGHTGLTPITGAPSCSAAGGQRSLHGDDLSAAAPLHTDGGLSPTTLMTL